MVKKKMISTPHQLHPPPALCYLSSPKLKMTLNKKIDIISPIQTKFWVALAAFQTHHITKCKITGLTA
jgi:hypothetical protein